MSQENGQQDEDFPIDDAETATAQADGPAKHQIQQDQLVSIKVPMGQIPNLARQQPQSQQRYQPGAPKTLKELNSKEFLDEMIMDPMSINYQIAVYRYAPDHYDGEDILCGNLMTTAVQPLESLSAAITQSWGGGSYRAVIVDGGGSPVITEKFKSAILIAIPIAQVRPKNARREKAASSVVAVQDRGEETESKRRMREIQEKALIDEAERRERKKKRDADLEDLKYEVELKRLRGDNDGDSQTDRRIVALEAQLKEVTNTLTNSLKEISGGFTNALKDVMAEVRNVKGSNDSNNQNQMILAMSKQSSDLMAAIIPAMASKNNSNDTDKILEHQRQSFEMALKIGQKDNSAQNQMMMTLVNQALAAKDNTQFGPDAWMKIMAFGENRLKNAIELARGEDDGGGEAAANMLAGLGAGDKVQAGWMGIAQSLLANPAIAPFVGMLAQRFFGTQNPQQQDFNRAGQAAMRQGMPQIPPMQHHQLPTTFSTPPALPNNQQRMPQQLPQQQQFPTAPQQFNVPQVPPIAPPQTDQVASPPMQSGHTPSAVVASVPPLDIPAPTGLDTAPEEGEEEEDGDIVDPSTSEDPQERLKFFVTESMKIALRDMQDKRQVREWTEDALSYWGNNFLAQLSQLTTRDMVVQAIANYTDDAVWGQLLNLVQADANEYQLFISQVDAMIAAIREAIQKATAQQTVQVTQVVAQQVTIQPTAPVVPTAEVVHQAVPVVQTVTAPQIPTTPEVVAAPAAQNNQAVQGELAAAAQ